MKTLVGMFLVCCCIIGCDRQTKNSNMSSPEEQKQLVDSINTFSIDFYKKTIVEKSYDHMPNIMVSPVGVSVLLGMLYKGADSEVASEIENKLGWETLKECVHPAFHDVLRIVKDQQDVQLYLAGQLWFNDGYKLNHAYSEAMDTYYNIIPESVPLGKNNSVVGRRISKWIEKETHGAIKSNKIDLGAVDSTSLLLASVVYFKGQWMYQFDPAATSEDVFYLPNDTSIKVDMMQQQATFNYLDTEGYQVLEMPYKGNLMSMIIFLPFKDQFKKFQEELSWQEVQKGIIELKKTKDIRVLIPKFEFRNRLAVIQPLISMGLEKTFATSSGFSSITSPSNGFRVDDLSQETYINVDEEGTEAYAVTKGIQWPWISTPRHKIFHANRPFIFLIRDLRSGMILFIGKVSNPKLL